MKPKEEIVVLFSRSELAKLNKAAGAKIWWDKEVDMWDGDEKEFDKVTKFVHKVTMKSVSIELLAKELPKGKITKDHGKRRRRNCCKRATRSRNWPELEHRVRIVRSESPVREPRDRSGAGDMGNW
jgi:hypothetical protein